MSLTAVAQSHGITARTGDVHTRALLQIVRLILAVTVLALAWSAPPASASEYVSAQGCSQCSESVGQTPASTQSAYRKGIVLLVIAAGGVFASAVIVLRRFR